MFSASHKPLLSPLRPLLTSMTHSFGNSIGSKGEMVRKVGEHDIWVLIFHILCQKNGDCEVKKIIIYRSFHSTSKKNAVLSPALLNRKPSYLMQYLVSSDTNMESVIFGNNIKKIRKKKYYHVYIYLTNVKGFFLFMCASCESKILLFFFF